MVIVFTIIAGLSILFSFSMLTGWRRIQSFSNDPNFVPFEKISVIIPIRNEKKNIGDLLEDLEKQSYPKQLFEVLLIDDHSDDDTFDVIEQKKGQLELEFRVYINIGIGKKSAIETGISQASGEFVMTTDGDCRVGSNWLSSIAAFRSEKNAVLISAPVRYFRSHKFWDRMLMMEFAALQGTGAVTLNNNYPTMCNGANISYLKSAFIEVGGYEGNKQIASGDDEFLMHRIFKRYPDQVHFLKSVDAMVDTKPASNLKEWINQRLRWASKWRGYEIKSPRLIGFLIFLTNMNVIFGLALLLLGLINSIFLLSYLLVKILSDYLFISLVNRFMNRPSSILIFIFIELIYPIYVLCFGILGLLGNYTWKGRNSSLKNDR